MKKLVLLFSLFILTRSAVAQVFMRPFDNAAAMGIGGASIALPNTAFGLNNEAQLGFAERLVFMAGTAVPYTLGGWSTAQFQGLAGIGKTSGVGLSVFHSSTESYLEQKFQLAYGRKLGEKFQLGASADLLRTDAAEYGSHTLPTFSVSFLAQALPHVWVGARLQNPFQQKIETDLVPTVLKLGASWKPNEVFLVTLESEKDLERPVQIKAGLSYQPSSALSLRAGMRSGKGARMCFGAGLHLKSGLNIDLGSEWHPVLGITPAAMITWRKI
ncbi:MAG: hypothetical protein JNJ57_18315 [Saprospiraceae bacterium]|nr:hypothetical protein [Saprospiraceae bacterium]